MEEAKEIIEDLEDKPDLHCYKLIEGLSLTPGTKQRPQISPILDEQPILIEDEESNLNELDKDGK